MDSIVSAASVIAAAAAAAAAAAVQHQHYHHDRHDRRHTDSTNRLYRDHRGIYLSEVLGRCAVLWCVRVPGGCFIYCPEKVFVTWRIYSRKDPRGTPPPRTHVTADEGGSRANHIRETEQTICFSLSLKTACCFFLRHFSMAFADSFSFCSAFFCSRVFVQQPPLERRFSFLRSLLLYCPTPAQKLLTEVPLFF